MLRSIVLLAVTASSLVAVQSHADVYKFTDAKGNVQYTDKPATLPAERLNVQSQKTDVVAMQERQEAEMKRLQESTASRQQATNQNVANKAAGEQTAKDKAERCVKARERYDSYMTSQRLYESQANGERRYLTDAELTAARSNAKTAMDELCK
jgi:Domain of unknown function (DUF4124)